MISTDIVRRERGEVTLKYSARCFKVGLPEKVASVPGTMISDCAKMIGMTPDELMRSGMNVFCPSRIRPRPTTLRGIWIGARHHEHHHDEHDEQDREGEGMGPQRLDRAQRLRPHPLDDREEDEQARAV